MQKRIGGRCRVNRGFEPRQGGWKLGKVKQVIKSDGVRRVKIEYKSFGEKEGTDTSYKGKPYTEIERPVRRLVVLLPAAEERNESEKNETL